MNRRDALKNTALLGGSIALSSTLLTLLQSCQEENRLGWQPRFLSTDQAQLVSSLVDTILPTTETPGGLEVKVDLFIDRVLAELYSEEAQKSVAAEMEQFNEQCVSQFGSPFAQLDPGQKKKVLQAEETQSPQVQRRRLGNNRGRAEASRFLSFVQITGSLGIFQFGRNR
jgi:hypothetical protein